jgi:hypothetical protein
MRAWCSGPATTPSARAASRTAYRVTGSGPARLLMMTGDRDFAEFVREISQPAKGADLPAPSEPDLERVVATAARYGMEILGPMPD